MPVLRYACVQADVAGLDLDRAAAVMLVLMLRNVATDGYRFSHPEPKPEPDTVRYSQPGCILASPSYPAEQHAINQDYVYNWTRDAAVTVVELALAQGPLAQGVQQNLADYLAFAEACQHADAPLTRGSYEIAATARDWSDQSDGPALRLIAVLQLLPRLDQAALAVARRVVAADLDCVLSIYPDKTTSLWEEHHGYSFFARAVQLRALREVAGTPMVGSRGGQVQAAIGELTAALGEHWTGELFRTLLEGDQPAGYDPNIDVVMAAVYGALDVLDGRLLTTASALREHWTDPASPHCYPINLADADRDLGPLIGRYPDDQYDGDTGDKNSGDRHPWVLTTCNVAELYYRVAAALAASPSLVIDDRTALFYQQVGVIATTSVPDAVTKLRDAGDRMLRAVLFHSDHLELSEQLDGTTGYQKSVRNLTWSYAAFLSAVRARTNS